MSIFYLSDLRSLVEFAKSRDACDSAVSSVEEMLKAMESDPKYWHKDLWEYDTTHDVHPLRKIMAEAARTYKQAEEQLRDEQKKSRPVEAKWSTKIYPLRNENDYWCDVPKDFREHAVRIVMTLTNRDEFDKALHYWGSGPGVDNERRSLAYYPITLGDGRALISHKGGGWMLLKNDLIVSMDQWLQFVDGKIELPTEWYSDGRL